MGLLQATYRTYEQHMQLVGVLREGKVTLTPISHAVQNAQIEITIDREGSFQSAAAIPKEQNKTIIPVTQESAGRVSTAAASIAHPLCDQVQYLLPYNQVGYPVYLAQLEQWAGSEFSHPKVEAVLAYVQKGTILNDLAAAGIVQQDEQGTLAEGRIEGIEYAKCLVRWRINPPEEGRSAACWEDQSLFDAFVAYYAHRCAQGEQDLCMISGAEDVVAVSHPKGVIASSFGAKLISANDLSGFTYRGRFTDARQAGSIGYTATQKAHSALRWIVANQGIMLGGRTFICWNPEGKPTPTFEFLGGWGNREEEPADTDVRYRKQLRETLAGYRQGLDVQDDIMVAALDAATTGRLSVTYYNELKASDFLDRLERWYDSCRWSFGRFGIQSPSAKRIVQCSFGVQRGSFIEADERALKEHIQQLLHCIVDAQPIPADLLRALTVRASTPLAYTPGNWETVLSTACAVIRKHHNDKVKREEWSMELDTKNTNRSYLFGRLLAVAERVEGSTYGYGEERATNALRMQSVFCQRPMYAWGILEKALNPYFNRLPAGLCRYFKDIISEITEKLPPPGDPELGKKLQDVYLLGYYLQRAALSKKKETVTEEE